MCTHATSCIGETGLKIFNGFLIFFNGFPIFLNGFPKSSTAFCFPRNPRKSIYGEKYTKDHYLSIVFFATRSPTCAPSFVIPATIPNTFHFLLGFMIIFVMDCNTSICISSPAMTFLIFFFFFFSFFLLYCCDDEFLHCSVK
jgi:hypothetical protein